MSALRFAVAILLTLTLSAMAAAQEPAPEQPSGDAPPTDEAQKKALGQFDADADGKLSETEIGMAREFIQALRRAVGDRMEDRGDRGPRRWRGEGRPPGDPPADIAPADGGPGRRRFEGRRPEGRGPEGDRPPGRRRFRGRDGEESPPPGEAPPFRPGPGPNGPPGPEGPPRPDGPPGPPPRPMELFGEFDANDDNQLSRDEFEKLIVHMREHRRPGPPGRSGEGPRFGPPGNAPADGPGPGAGDRPPRPGREGGRRPPRPDADDAASAPERPSLDESAAPGDAAA